MRNLIYFILTILLFVPLNSYAGMGGGDPLIQSRVSMTQTDRPDEEVFAYYDLRERKTYIQVSNVETQDSDVLPTVCIHVQIFQQDQGCSELNFEDELTPNDTVVYDMDNLLRNDGSSVPVNLDDDSYGFVAISAYDCNDTEEEELSNPLLGNFRIVDDTGYEYRMNLLTDRNSERQLILLNDFDPPGTPALANILIPFNTVDGANHADIVGFIVEDNRNLAGSNEDGGAQDLVYNEEAGISFDVFQLDENEERLSCDRKTIGCGPNIVMNYGINEDYPASRGDNLLCEGAGLLPGQEHGYISLENATFLSPIDAVDNPPENDFEFICLVGLNNGNGTGSMDSCQAKCLVDIENCSGLN